MLFSQFSLSTNQPTSSVNFHMMNFSRPYQAAVELAQTLNLRVVQTLNPPTSNGNFPQNTKSVDHQRPLLRLNEHAQQTRCLNLKFAIFWSISSEVARCDTVPGITLKSSDYNLVIRLQSLDPVTRLWSLNSGTKRQTATIGGFSLALCHHLVPPSWQLTIGKLPGNAIKWNRCGLPHTRGFAYGQSVPQLRIYSVRFFSEKLGALPGMILQTRQCLVDILGFYNNR